MSFGEQNSQGSVYYFQILVILALGRIRHLGAGSFFNTLQNTSCGQSVLPQSMLASSHVCQNDQKGCSFLFLRLAACQGIPALLGSSWEKYLYNLFPFRGGVPCVLQPYRKLDLRQGCSVAVKQNTIKHLNINLATSIDRGSPGGSFPEILTPIRAFVQTVQGVHVLKMPTESRAF